jgi:hypothetical protein
MEDPEMSDSTYDVALFDTDGDGEYDTALIDTDFDGQAEIEIDGLGPESASSHMYIDTDGDGTVDAETTVTPAVTAEDLNPFPVEPETGDSGAEPFAYGSGGDDGIVQDDPTGSKFVSIFTDNWAA